MPPSRTGPSSNPSYGSAGPSTLKAARRSEPSHDRRRLTLLRRNGAWRVGHERVDVALALRIPQALETLLQLGVRVLRPLGAALVAEPRRHLGELQQGATPQATERGAHAFVVNGRPVDDH